MQKQFSSIVGVSLILLGALALMVNLIIPSLGINLFAWTIGRFWPVIIVVAGWLLVLFPLLVRDRRGLGGLFIVGLPVLATGSISLFASFFDWWGAWEWLWPVEILSLALGFLLAAFYMQRIWLAVPAIIIGLNGLVFQFCAVTGLWEMWSVLWTVEPLAVGVALIVMSLRKQSSRLFMAGLILCGLAGLAFLLMTGILAATVAWPWLWLMVPLTLMLTGVSILGFNLLRRLLAPKFY